MKQLYILYLLLIPVLVTAQIPKYASRPSATTVVFLDFDGHVVKNTAWNDTQDEIIAAPTSISAEEIFKIYRIVKEDFVTFNINITTDSMYYEQASIYSRHRVIITPTSAWCDEGTGIAVIGGLTFGDESPSFVFSDRLNYNYYNISQIITHEIGHALGLQHISVWNEDCTLENEYKGKQGTNFPTFSPIMGTSFNSDISGWVNDFSLLSCEETQNEIEMFHTGRFGFISIPDDISNYFAYAKTFSPFTAHVTDGIITDSNDVDIFKVTLPGRQIIDIDVTPNRINKQTYAGINFIPAVDLYNADSVLIRTYQNPTGIDVFIDTVLNAGTYYFKVRSIAGENLPFGSSFGSYEFLYLVRDIALNDLSIQIEGKQQGHFHELNWSSNQKGLNSILEYSLDGVNFLSLYQDKNYKGNYKWKPVQNGAYFYRMRVLNKDGYVLGYSSVIRMQMAQEVYRLMYNMIRDKIELWMFEPGEYELMTIQGKSLQKGKLNAGFQHIQIQNKVKGVVLLRIVLNGSTYVEKLVVL